MSISSFRSELGTTAILGIGLSFISISTVLVLASATSLAVAQRRVTTLSEMAALSGAKYGLSAADFVSYVAVTNLSGLRVAQDSIVDGLTREVEICATWQPPIPAPIDLPNVEICGNGSAREG